MLISIKFFSAGEEVMEKIASPTGGTESMAHCPGIYSKGGPPPGATMRKVLISTVSRLILSITASHGTKGFSRPTIYTSKFPDNLGYLKVYRTHTYTAPTAHAGINTKF
jgi:hypothetical protein